jgi:hypothetical protein
MFAAGTLNGYGLAKGWGPELMVVGGVLFFTGSWWLSRIRSEQRT